MPILVFLCVCEKLYWGAINQLQSWSVETGCSLCFHAQISLCNEPKPCFSGWLLSSKTFSRICLTKEVKNLLNCPDTKLSEVSLTKPFEVKDSFQYTCLKRKYNWWCNFFLWCLLLLGANWPSDCNKLSKLLKIKQILHNSLLQVNKEDSKGICIIHVKDQAQNILTNFSRKTKIVDFSFVV